MLRRLGSIALVSSAACATARPLVPLGEGRFAIDGAAPAVFFNSDPPLTVPSPTIGVRAGVSDDAEVRLTLHPMHLFLEHRPILGIGTGAIFHLSPAEDWIPGLHFTADLTLFAPLKGGSGPDAIVAGDAAVIVHWEPLPWLFPYVLLDAAAASNQNSPITSLYAGLQFWPRGRVEFSVELGWFAFSVDAEELTLPLIGPGRGVLYVGGAISLRLGERYP